jgi:dTMP kinase
MPLIVLEGIDGCGKTTQADLLEAELRRRELPVTRVREPGGTRLGEQVRALLLDPATDACPVAELFGYLTARAQLCHAILKPAIARGDWVLMDRFWPSTMAYQATGLGLDPRAVRAAIELSLGGLRLDLGVWFDVSPALALARRQAARGSDDRIEARGLAYQERVAAGYAALVTDGTLIRIDATLPPAQVFAQLISLVFPAHS